MNAKRKTPAMELAVLLKDVCGQLLVDMQRADNGDHSADVAAWANLYNEAAALLTRLVPRGDA